VAISIVQKDPNSTTWATAGPVSSLTSTGTGSATTTGNRLIALATLWNSSGIGTGASFSDNGTHGWTQDGYSDEDDTTVRFLTAIARTTTITGRSDHEVTVSGPASSYFVLGVLEVSGIDGTTPVQDAELGYGGGSSCSTVELTLSGGTDLVLALCTDDAGGTWTRTWTGATLQWEGPADIGESLLSSAATEDPTWTKSSTAHWCACAVAYKAGAGGPAIPPHDGVAPWSSIWRTGRV
jgi:hypothetical protein